MADENVQAAPQDAPVSDDTSKTKKAKASDAQAKPSKPPVLRAGVHYVTDDYSHLEGGQKPGEHVSAQVLAIYDDEAVSLLSQGSLISPVGHDEGGAVGTWHWPEPEKES